MKTFSTTAIIALMTATLGVSAIAPAMAQDGAPAVEQAQPAEPAAPAPGMSMGPRHSGGSFGGLLGLERGAEAVEIALVRLSHAIDLTDAQQTLFDTLKRDALAAAESFETTIESLRPIRPAEGATPTMPDMNQMLQNRIAMTEAQLAALQTVQPSFTAFFGSLTDQQKTELMPQRGERGEHRGRFGSDHDGGRHGGPGGRPNRG